EEGEVDVIEVLVSEGEEINSEVGLITLETDKATMDVPSPQAGVEKADEVKVGDKVKQGTLGVMLEVAGGSAGAADESDTVARRSTPGGSEAADESDTVARRSTPGGSEAAENGSDPAKAGSDPAPKQPPVPDHPLDKKSKAEGLA